MTSSNSCSTFSQQCQTVLCSTPWGDGNTPANQAVRQEFCSTGLPGLGNCGDCTQFYGSSCCSDSDFSSCFINLQRTGVNCGDPGPGNTLTGGMSPPPPTGTSSTPRLTTTLPRIIPTKVPPYNDSTTTQIIVPPPIYTSVVSSLSSASIIVPPLNQTIYTSKTSSCSSTSGSSSSSSSISVAPTSVIVVTTSAPETTSTAMSTVVPPPVTVQPSSSSVTIVVPPPESISSVAQSSPTPSELPSPNLASSTAASPAVWKVMVGAGAVALFGLGNVMNYI